MTPAKATGILSIAAGIIACICLVTVMAALFVAPIGIITGGVAVYKGQTLLGLTGIGLSVLALVIAILLLWNWGWFSAS